MAVFIISLIILVALLLILVVLAQNSKGGGISSEFGGSATSQIMGVKKTGDLLERVTWGLAVALMALTLSTNFLIKDVQSTEGLAPDIEGVQGGLEQPGITLPQQESGSQDLESLVDEDSAS